MFRQLSRSTVLFLALPLTQASAADLRTQEKRFVETAIQHIQRFSVPQRRNRACEIGLRTWMTLVFARKQRISVAPKNLQACYGPRLQVKHVSFEGVARHVPVTPREITSFLAQKYKKPAEMRILCCKIAYIRISEFSPEAEEYLHLKLHEHREQMRHVHRFIIDVRGNPGGRVAVLQLIASWFAPYENQVAYYEVRGRQKRPIILKRIGFLQRRLWIAILANNKSASASEMLMAILKRWHKKRVIFIGRRTYGKGTIQSVRKIGNYYVSVTYAKWAVGGRIYDRVGITPDISITGSQDNGGNSAIKRAIILLRK